MSHIPLYGVQFSPLSQLEQLGVHIIDTISRPPRREWMCSIRRTESIKSMNDNLNSLAIIATFLAAVQAQVLTASMNQNGTNLQIATNALLFGGLFINALSGTIGIMGANQLQRTYGLLQQRETSIHSLADALKKMSHPSKEASEDHVALFHHLYLLQLIIFPLLHTPRLWNTQSAIIAQSAPLLEQIILGSDLPKSLKITATYTLSDYRHATNRLAKSASLPSLAFAASLLVPWLVLAGLCCFTTGVLCLVFDSQPRQVWAVSISALGCTGLLLLGVIVFIVKFDPRPVAIPFGDA
ncbi:hypothetical protein C8R46DRAFT_1056999 [Mycena filopes]|nr:hypothetical protein C8R46DRAFT_1056999 [Mycena filopes]